MDISIRKLLAIFGIASLTTSFYITDYHLIAHLLILIGVYAIRLSLNKKLWIDEPY